MPRCCFDAEVSGTKFKQTKLYIQIVSLTESVYPLQIHYTFPPLKLYLAPRSKMRSARLIFLGSRIQLGIAITFSVTKPLPFLTFVHDSSVFPVYPAVAHVWLTPRAPLVAVRRRTAASSLPNLRASPSLAGLRFSPLTLCSCRGKATSGAARR